MKLLKTAVLAAIMTSSAIASFAQSAEEIVTKHIEATGGEANWKKVNAIKMTGSMTIQGMEMPIIITTVNKKAMRMDITIMGTSNYQIITDKEGWGFFPIQQQQKPEPMTADQVKESQDQLLVQDEFLNYKKDGSKIEFLGKDDMEGTEVLKLKLTDKDGKEKTFFFDASNYYILRQSQKVNADGKETDVVVNYSNFQKLPAGITFPMTIEQEQTGPINFTSVEVNPNIDESIFKPAQ
ncbi:MAG TPA: hypothetical protein VL093_06655 [Flavipsychrobacter sp.]|nr:hypothetical protein [Flavipsychrobacter sp.]